MWKRYAEFIMRSTLDMCIFLRSFFISVLNRDLGGLEIVVENTFVFYKLKSLK